MAEAGSDVADYIAERARDFTGREWVISAIDAWLADPEGARFFAITGEPGIGKTAIAARLTQVRPIAAHHFCRARRAETLDPLDFARNLSLQLTRQEDFARQLVAEQGTTIRVDIAVGTNEGRVVGVQIDQLIVRAPSPGVAFNRVVMDPLKAIYASADAGHPRAPLLIVVDALDEAAQHPGSETIVDLLANARGLPPAVRFVVTTRPDGAVLRHLAHQDTQVFSLDAGGDRHLADVGKFVEQKIATSAELRDRLAAAGLPASTFSASLARASTGNFLYLVFLLSTMADGSRPIDDLDALPQGLDGIYGEFLRTRTVGKDIALWRSYRPLLGTLAAAQAPLTEQQLGAMSSASAQTVADFVIDVGQFLEPSLAAHDSLALYHQSLTNFLADKRRAGEFWIDIASVHRQIASSFVGPDTHQDGRTRLGAAVLADPYALRYLPRHLFLAGDLPGLKSLLFDLAWPQAKLASLDINAVVADYGLDGGDEATALVRGALGMVAHVLARDKSQLGAQLWARLEGLHQPAIVRLLADIDTRRTGPWLRSMHASLSRPGGALIRTFIGHAGSVKGVAALPDGVRAISASSDRSLRLWDLESGALLREFRGHENQLNAVALSPDGRIAVSSDWSHTLIAWDVETGRKLGSFFDQDFILGELAMTPDGLDVVFTPYRQSPRRWNLATGACDLILPDLAEIDTPLALLDQGRRAVFGNQAELQIWDLQTRKLIRALGKHPHVSSVAVSPDERRLISRGGGDRSDASELLWVWDLETGQVLHRLAGHAGWISDVAVTPDGKRAISAGSDRTLKVWDLDSGALLRTFTGHTGEVFCVAVLPDGKRAISGGADSSLRMWNLQAGNEAPGALAHKDAVCAIAMLPDGQHVATGSWDMTAQVWDIRTGAPVRTLAGHYAAVKGVAVSAGGMEILTASSDGSVRVWDSASGQCSRRIECDSRDDGGLDAIAVTPDGKRFVVMRDPWSLVLWNLEDERFERVLSRYEVDTALAIAPDGRLVVAPTLEGELHVWDLESGTMRTIDRPESSPEPGVAEAVALDSTGHVAVVGHRDGMVRVWDVAAGRVTLTAHPHQGAVRGAAILPCGRRAVTASEDWSVCVWDLQSGTVLARLTADGALMSLAVSADGRVIVVGERSGRVHFLRLEGDASDRIES